MDGTGPEHALSDLQLDRELESALGIAPSPEFLARVRTRIAADVEPSSWRSRVSFATRRTALQPLAALAVAGVLLAVVIPQLMRSDVGESKPDIVKPRVVEVGGAQQRQVGQQLNHPAVMTRVRAGVVPVTDVPLRLSKPLFAATGDDALVVLVAAMEEGRAAALPVVAPAGESSLDVRELKIEPLVLEPLPQLAELGAL